MKLLKFTIVFLTIILTLIFSNCNRNKIEKKKLKEVLVENKWKLTAWKAVPGINVLEPTDFTNLYARYYASECKKNSYSIYDESDTIFYYDLCNDTVWNCNKWKIENNNKFHIIWQDSTIIWDVVEYTDKNIDLKIDYIFHYSGGSYEVTETKTLTSF